MAKIKKAQGGALMRGAAKLASKLAPKVASKVTKAAVPKKSASSFGKDTKEAFRQIERDELRKMFKDIDKSDVIKKRSGGKVMLKRADGSVSQRGLWDNIRAAAKKNKAAGKPGKKPTAQMLKQERKIKAKSK